MRFEWDPKKAAANLKKHGVNDIVHIPPFFAGCLVFAIFRKAAAFIFFILAYFHY